MVRNALDPQSNLLFPQSGKSGGEPSHELLLLRLDNELKKALV